LTWLPFLVTGSAFFGVVVSLYYYLLVLKASYLLEPEETQPAIRLSTPIKFLTGSLVLAMVVGGIFPRHIIELTAAAVEVLIKTL
jgi:NADH-quinone oxidoreductase subunit N